MIVYSTPGSITWASINGRQLTFSGEWTLEPKFYLDFFDAWDNGEILNDSQKEDVLKEFLKDTSLRGWVIVIPKILVSKNSNNSPQ
jgi:hypothetical protein